MQPVKAPELGYSKWDQQQRHHHDQQALHALRYDRRHQPVLVGRSDDYNGIVRVSAGAQRVHHHQELVELAPPGKEIAGVLDLAGMVDAQCEYADEVDRKDGDVD